MPVFADAIEFRMGQLLKIVSVLALGWQLFGGEVTNAILNKVDYSFSRLRRNGIRPDIINGNVVGLLRLEILFRQTFGVNLALQQLQLSISQQGRFLGQVMVNDPVALPNALTVPIPVDVVVPAGQFLDRLLEVLKDRNAQWQAPLDIQGTLTLSNGVAVPVFSQLDFMNL